MFFPNESRITRMEIPEREKPRSELGFHTIQTEKTMFAIHTALLSLLVALGAAAPAAVAAAAPAGKPLEPLCRDYREYNERRPMVDRQQVSLLPRFQSLEEVCQNEAKPPALSGYTCTLPSRAPVKGSCCTDAWDCLKSSQSSCESTEALCRGLGATWSKE